jgi:hypothetical protein
MNAYLKSKNVAASVEVQAGRRVLTLQHFSQTILSLSQRYTLEKSATPPEYLYP